MKPVYWQVTDLGGLQALPHNAQAVSTWDDQDAALADVARGVSRTVKEIVAARERTTPLPDPRDGRTSPGSSGGPASQA